MPIFTFKCERCGKREELIQRNPMAPICCRYEMVRVPTAENIEVRGYSAKNGYAKCS